MTKTVGFAKDDDPGKPCIFPFTSGDVTYNQCVHGIQGSWCATEVDTNGHKTEWGYCHVACPGGVFVGPSDVGGTCPDGSSRNTVADINDHCCCGSGNSCCWAKCTFSTPPEDCLPPGAEWKFNATLSGHYQAVPAG